MPRRLRHTLWAALPLLLASAAVRADAPNFVTQDGVLFASLPQAGPVDIEIRIFDAGSAGNLLYHEVHSGTALSEGSFEIAIGSGSVVTGTFGPALFGQPDRWVELVVDGNPFGPREKLRSAPTALESADADTVGGLDQPAIAALAPQGPQGPPGNQGPTGPAGSLGGSNGLYVVCANGQSSFAGCRNCGPNGQQLTLVREACVVNIDATPNEGTCSLPSSVVGECCVCQDPDGSPPPLTYAVCAEGVNNPFTGCRNCGNATLVQKDVAFSGDPNGCSITTDTGSCSLAPFTVGECCECRP